MNTKPPSFNKSVRRKRRKSYKTNFRCHECVRLGRRPKMDFFSRFVQLLAPTIETKTSKDLRMITEQKTLNFPMLFASCLLQIGFPDTQRKVIKYLLYLAPPPFSHLNHKLCPQSPPQTDRPFTPTLSVISLFLISNAPFIW